MRFDDRLATVLARDPDRDVARVTQWRQLLDLLAQERHELAGPALDRLAALRAQVPVAVRSEAATAIAGRPLAPAVVALLADDLPAVAGAVLRSVRLDAADWLAVLPRLSPTGRGFLRHRRDLDPVVEDALARFGADFALDGAVPAEHPLSTEEVSGNGKPTDADEGGTRADLSGLANALDEQRELPLAGGAAAIEPFEPGAGEGQIRAIISRIARFRSRDDASPSVAVAQEFQFETGPDGTLRWVEGVPRGPLIGESIATPASDGYGVDGQAPGAFRRRAAFRDARLTVAGTSGAGGEWRIAGVPVFAPADGRFVGYRGTGRRPRDDERAEASARPVVEPDTLRQLVHELRTPINAIGGFAEMIRHQMRGPVAQAYRDRADGIAGEAARLMVAVDDLDLSARLDGDRLGLQRAAIDVAALVEALCAETPDDRRADLVRDARALPPALGDASAIRRMVARLIGAATALAGPDETLRVSLGAEGDALDITVTRPSRLAGVEDAALFDPGYRKDMDWPDAPLLGLGFSLHLVRRLAAATGGALSIADDRFVLRLPIARPADDARLG